jgi:monoamine oxidase
MNGRLYFSGTETAGEFAGYMEGALIAAKRTANIITG